MKIFYEEENKARINKHIELVKTIMLRIGHSLNFDEKSLLERAKVHDLTKFSNDEILGYMLLGDEKEHARILTIEEKAIVNKAIEHHYRNNSHHPQYYDDCNKMTDLDLLEMVSDWLACAIEKGRSPVITNSYNFNEANYQKILQYAKIGIDSFNLIDNSNGK
jgi:hypothetical protein